MRRRTQKTAKYTAMRPGGRGNAIKHIKAEYFFIRDYLLSYVNLIVFLDYVLYDVCISY